MPRKKEQTYELKQRKLPNGNLSTNYYARIPDENGKRQYVSFGPNIKNARVLLKQKLAEIEKEKTAASLKQPEEAKVQTFLEYVREKHFLGADKKGTRLDDNPEYLQNPLYLQAINNNRKRYGKRYARKVSGFLRRLLVDCNDEIGLCPYNKITKAQVVALKNRLETGTLSSNFKTAAVKNTVLDILSSIYGYIMDLDPSVEYNPFQMVKRFDEEDKIREPLNLAQIQMLFPTEDEINYKFKRLRIEEEKQSRAIAIKKIQDKSISESAKESFITMIMKESDQRIEKIEKEKAFTSTPYYLFFLFCLATGCRKGEIRALQYSSFCDFPWVRIERAFNTERNSREDIGLPKMKKKRIIYLCPTLQKKLSYCKPVLTSIQNNTLLYQKAPDSFVFSEDPEGKTPLGITQLWNHWNTFIKAMGYTTNRITFHYLRHTFEFLLDKEPGIKEAWIAKYCGWENPNESKVQRNYKRTKNPFEQDNNLRTLAEAVERIYFKSRIIEEGLSQ